MFVHSTNYLALIFLSGTILGAWNISWSKTKISALYWGILEVGHDRSMDSSSVVTGEKVLVSESFWKISSNSFFTEKQKDEQ